MEYQASKFKGKEWGIFAKKSNCWVVFGSKKEMQERARKLNKLEGVVKNGNA